MTNENLLQQALDALEYHQEQTRPIHKTAEAIAALRAALAAAPVPPQQGAEPSDEQLKEVFYAHIGHAWNFTAPQIRYARAIVKLTQECAALPVTRPEQGAEPIAQIRGGELHWLLAEDRPMPEGAMLYAVRTAAQPAEVETAERDGCDPSLLGKKIGYHSDGEPFGYITEQEREEALAARGVKGLGE